MKIVIGDISEEELRSLPRNRINTRVLAHEGMRIYPCIGCMDCFGRRVGHCAISDGLTDGLERLGYFEELEFVSACLYGGFSMQVKCALDRLFAYFRPAVEVRKGETRFAAQAVGKIDLVLRFYDLRSEAERKTALSFSNYLVKMLNAEKSTILFYRTKEDLLAGRELRGTLDAPVPNPGIAEGEEGLFREEERSLEPFASPKDSADLNPSDGPGVPAGSGTDGEEVAE